MKSTSEILSTEYSERFDSIRKNMMVVSYHKYGPVSANYKTHKAIDAVASMKKRIEKYAETGNTEYLADVANFAMIEFMCPQHPKAHYKPTDSMESPGVVGMGVKEVERFMEGERDGD